MDMSLRIIASDRGAGQIFNPEEEDGEGQDAGLIIPDEVLKELRIQTQTGTSCRTTHFQVGWRRYRCRSYLLEREDSKFRPAILAVHFDSEELANDPVAPIVAEYRLTDREEESLRGIALGLTTKELADRMRISPNTVKTHVRVIMLKLGVTTRGAIFRKILDLHGTAK